MDLEQTEKKSFCRNMQLLSLIFAALVESFTMLYGSRMSNDFISFATMCVNMAAAMFVGLSITQFPQNKVAKTVFLTGTAFCALAGCLQLLDMQQFSLQWDYDPPYRRATIFSEYMMMLPMGAMLDDQNKDRGLLAFSLCFLLAVLGHVLLTWELFRGKVPYTMRHIMQWQGTRLSLMWHPNILAGILLIGLGLSLSLAFRFKKLYLKIPLFVFSAVEFYMITLTNARAVMAMASCLLGGIVFFLVYHGNWKQFLLGLIAAAVVIFAAFAGANAAYSAHVERFVADIADQQAAEKTAAAEKSPETLAAAETSAVGTGSEPRVVFLANITPAPEVILLADTIPAEERTPTIDTQAIENKLKQESGQGDLRRDFAGFNGRNGIWRGVFLAMKERPLTILTGTRDIGTFISPYNPFDIQHAHNSWLQVFAGTGIIGIGIILYLTWLAVKSSLLLFFVKKSAMYQKIIALLVIAVMGAEFFEVYIFYVEFPRNFIQMAFMLCLGYVIYWAHSLPDIEKNPRQTEN